MYSDSMIPNSFSGLAYTLLVVTGSTEKLAHWDKKCLTSDLKKNGGYFLTLCEET